MGTVPSALRLTYTPGRVVSVHQDSFSEAKLGGRQKTFSVVLKDQWIKNQEPDILILNE